MAFLMSAVETDYNKIMGVTYLGFSPKGQKEDPKSVTITLSFRGYIFVYYVTAHDFFSLYSSETKAHREVETRSSEVRPENYS